MSRTQRISHYLERSLDSASLIAALATARTDLPSDLTRFADRQDQQLIDLLHDWAFNTRKLLELLKREKWPSSVHGQQPSIAAHTEHPSGEADEAEMSLWDICGRIIHSDRLTIDRSRVPGPDGMESTGEAAWGFNVASDRDKHGSSIFVFIEFLLSDFLQLEDALRRDLRNAIRLET